jgi:hypothetical protein
MFRKPSRPIPSPPAGTVVAAHFDDPIRMPDAGHVDHHYWFVAWRREVGLESL